MDYRKKILTETEEIINDILDGYGRCISYVSRTRSLYGFWKKIVPADEKIDQLMTFIELKSDLYNAEQALQESIQRNPDSVNALRQQVIKAEEGLSKINLFQTETQATEALCDYLMDVIKNLKKNKKK